MTAIMPSALTPFAQAMSQFQSFWMRQQIPQALLLCQESGASLREVSAALAAWVLCTAATAKGACGVCQSCQFCQDAAHPDYYTLGSPEALPSIDDIRILAPLLQQSAHQGGRKVVVLYGADAYSPAVANALLKMLEEPIGNVLYLLLAQRRQRIIPTILSRCIKWDLPSVAVSPTAMDCQFEQLCLHPETAAFYEPTLQAWLMEHPQRALAIWYQVILRSVRERASVESGSFRNRALLKPWMGFTDVLIQALQQAASPGMNKLLLMESVFFQWQTLMSSQESSRVTRK